MRSLPVKDVRTIVDLLGRVAVLDADIHGKRRFLMNGLARMLRADIWMWLLVNVEGSDQNLMAFMALSDGWENESSLLKFSEGTVSPAVAFLNDRLSVAPGHRTQRRSDVVPDKLWFSSELVRKYWEPSGCGEFINSKYPLGNGILSSVTLIRKPGRPNFTRREVCIFHLVTEEIDWLHRQGSNAPAGSRVGRLSTRQRQVLLQLLAGDSTKQIARKLCLSNYTINDHIKTIYARFGVSGRGELLSQFLAGGAANSIDQSQP